MDPALTDSLTIPRDVLFRELDDEGVLLNLKTGIYFGLNPVGTRIWQLVAEHGSLERVLDVMLQEYEIGRRELASDLLELSRQLCAGGLAEVVRAPQPRDRE
jgi:hypothetical protein